MKEKKTKEKKSSEGNKLPLRKRLHWKVYRKFPKLIKYPDAKESLKFYHERDPEENQRTTPDADVHINLHCFWAAEFFTPTHAENLIASFKKLGWDKDDRHGERSNPIVFIEELRHRIYGGGWMDLGTLVPHGQSTFLLPRGRNIDLPKGVEYAQARIFNLTASVACIVVGFTFDETYMSVYENALRKDYKTYLRPLSAGVCIMGPMLQKRDEIAALRRKIRKEFKSWFADNFSGVFCESEFKGNFPTCEFLSFEKAEPFPEKREQNSNRWLGLLEMDFSSDTWESRAIEGLKFSWPLLRDNETNFHAGLTISKENLDKLDMNMYGGHTHSAYIARLDMDTSELISRWACLALLDLHEKNLCKIRDSKNYKFSAKDSIKFLRSIRKLVSESIDIASLCPELSDFSRLELASSRDDFLFFSPERKKLGQNAIPFYESLSRAITSRAEQLVKTDRAIKEPIIQQGNLLGIVENIKLQKSIRRLTVMIGIVTIFLTYQTIPEGKISEIFVKIQNVFSYILQKRDVASLHQEGS